MRKYIICLSSIWLIAGFTFFLPEKVYSQSNSTYVKGITAGRARALVGVAVGLISLGVGWRAKTRPGAGAGKVRTGGIIALVLGIAGIILSVVHLISTAGAVFGSGSGKAGAIFAFIPNLVGIAFGALVLRKTSEKK
jgi:hypothetical protein